MTKIPRESYIGIGLIFGVGVGVAQDNVGLWMALGLCFGAALYASAKDSDENEED